MKEKLLKNVQSPPEAGIVTGILDDEHIPYYVKTPGAGSVYAASMNMGVKIYVSEEDYERALELVDGCLDGDVELVDFPEATDEPLSDEEEAKGEEETPAGTSVDEPKMPE